MKESYDEGLADHIGPESCMVVREDRLEALTGVRAGRVLSPESNESNPGADVGLTRLRRERAQRRISGRRVV